MMKHILLIILFTLFSATASADLAEITSALAEVTGIWQDSKGNYYSVQSDDEGNLLFLDLNHSTSRAEELIKLGVEIKPEYLAFFGKVSQENILSNGIGNLLRLEPLILLKQMYPEHADRFYDTSLRFVFSREHPAALSVSDASCFNVCDGGILGISIDNMNKVF